MDPGGGGGARKKKKKKKKKVGRCLFVLFFFSAPPPPRDPGLSKHYIGMGYVYAEIDEHTVWPGILVCLLWYSHGLHGNP